MRRGERVGQFALQRGSRLGAGGRRAARGPRHAVAVGAGRRRRPLAQQGEQRPCQLTARWLCTRPRQPPTLAAGAKGGLDGAHPDRSAIRALRRRDRDPCVRVGARVLLFQVPKDEYIPPRGGRWWAGERDDLVLGRAGVPVCYRSSRRDGRVGRRPLRAHGRPATHGRRRASGL